MSTLDNKNLVPGIVLNQLTKQYLGTQKPALNNLSIAINKGEVYGLLGPNGAGKSTTIRMLLNFIQPTSGSAKILGYDIVKESLKIRESIGYLAGDFAVYPKMTGKQYLDYISELQPNIDKSYRNKLIKLLNAQVDKKMGDLSRGNKQKIAIVQAFMHKPQVLILDEPSSGLDPLMQEAFYQLLNEAKARGTTTIISSHILAEVQKVCDRVGIIREGKLISERNIAEMSAEAAQTFDIVFLDKVPILELKKVKGLKVESSQGQNVTIHVHGKLSPLFAVLTKHEVVKIDARNLDLEEVFLRFYENEGAKK